MKKYIVIGIILLIFFFAPLIPTTVIQKIYPPKVDPRYPVGAIFQMTPFQFLKALVKGPK